MNNFILYIIEKKITHTLWLTQHVQRAVQSVIFKEVTANVRPAETKRSYALRVWLLLK